MFKKSKKGVDALPRSTPARLLRPSPRQAKRQVSTTKKSRVPSR